MVRHLSFCAIRSSTHAPFSPPSVRTSSAISMAGRFGGPIVKNRLFFFAGISGHESPRNTRRHTVSHAERAGAGRRFLRDDDTASGSRQPGCAVPEQSDPANRIRPFATTYLTNYLPAANSGTDFYTFAPSGTGWIRISGSAASIT